MSGGWQVGGGIDERAMAAFFLPGDGYVGILYTILLTLYIFEMFSSKKFFFFFNSSN